MALQREIERLETLIARRRELFNEQVYAYDSAIDTAAGVLLRPVFGWKDVPMFSASDEERGRPGATEITTA